MNTAEAQAFFEWHAGQFVAGAFDEIVPAYALPLSLHFDGEDVVLPDRAALCAMLTRHLVSLRRHGVTGLAPEVVDIEPGAAGRFRIEVIWRYQVSAAVRASRLDYFKTVESGAPKIEMVDFDLALPRRYAPLALDPDAQMTG